MRKVRNEELGRPTPEEFRKMEKIPVAVILDNVRSLNNVGSFFRTCDAFAIQELILCGITGTPPDREIHKTALGAENTVPWSYHSSAAEVIELLDVQGYTAVAVEQVEGAVMLGDFDISEDKKYALVFGNEVSGVSQDAVDACDHAIEIPQRGTKHSLNVAISGGIVLWEFFCSYQKES